MLLKQIPILHKKHVIAMKSYVLLFLIPIRGRSTKT